MAIVSSVLRRFWSQNATTAAPDEQIAAIATGLYRLVRERGLPAPLRDGELGQPGGLPDEECAQLAALAAPAPLDPLLADAVRQLVKACFYPEFRACRDSYCALSKDGQCRRQELPRVLRRISGTHCVDCPHWTGFTADEHRAFLRDRWLAGAARFDAHVAVYLPEDFRALRRWLHAAARA